jgi:hypothetical protein
MHYLADNDEATQTELAKESLTQRLAGVRAKDDLVIVH